jgi:RNA polymerase sigma-70 factor (ECF subfamily)
MPVDRDAVLAALFEAHFEPLLAYARRRTPQLSDAEDLVAETFSVAWRRLDRLPRAHEQQLPWLYGVARRLLANQRRGAARRLRLLDRLRSTVAAPPAGHPAPGIIATLAALPERDQELLRLIAWEGLTHAEAALVLGISPNAVAIRLHRARERLRRTMKGSAAIRTFPGWRRSVRRAEHREEA